ncbi:tyrosine--tRNA ligase [Candidatus Woesearchaeota archaeon]|nr:MAG: tyrosine--tRNA ligase [Candidatus Woesearchaeota archaeon]
MSPEERFELIKRNTAEIVPEDELLELLKAKEHPVAYIGNAPTGRIHIGYYFWISKVADFLKAGFKFKILLADLHAHLDDQKAPFELLDARVEYYKEVLTAMLESLDIDISNLEFVRGTDFQLEKDYTLDVYKLSALNTFSRCKKAASEVVRFGEHPKLSGFIYPILQALDEVYLNADVQFGGMDQRKILMFARENLPKIGYKPRIEVMTPLMVGLSGDKMSASDAKSKIDVLDSPEEVTSKIKSAYCVAGEVEGNGLLDFVRQVIMPYKQDKGLPFVIERPEKFGGNIEYISYKDLENDFAAKKLHPLDLKSAVAKDLNLLLDHVRKSVNLDTVKRAYPENEH